MGVTKIGSKYYYFSRTKKGALMTGWIKYGNDQYYASTKNNALKVNKCSPRDPTSITPVRDAKLYKGLKTIAASCIILIRPTAAW